MFDDGPFIERKERPSLMRALLIAPDAVLESIWRRILRQGAFDVIVVPDGVSAMRVASPYGLDLIVVAGDMGVIGIGEFLSFLHRGVFGPIPPPVILLRSGANEMALAEEQPFSGCVVVGAMNEHNFPDAIDRAFALRQPDAENNGGNHA